MHTHCQGACLSLPELSYLQNESACWICTLLGSAQDRRQAGQPQSDTSWPHASKQVTSLPRQPFSHPLPGDQGVPVSFFPRGSVPYKVLGSVDSTHYLGANNNSDDGCGRTFLSKHTLPKVEGNLMERGVAHLVVFV